jgi:hypothetical protein
MLSHQEDALLQAGVSKESFLDETLSCGVLSLFYPNLEDNFKLQTMSDLHRILLLRLKTGQNQIGLY